MPKTLTSDLQIGKEEVFNLVLVFIYNPMQIVLIGHTLK